MGIELLAKSRIRVVPTEPRLLELLNAQAAVLVSVATGGPKIASVNAKYVRRRRKLNTALRARGIDPPFPYEDLWAWYGHYSQQIPGWLCGTAAAHRWLSRSCREALKRALEGVQVSDPGTAGEATWAELDARVEGVASELRRASSLDDLQDVGRRCREILIDTAHLLVDPALVPAGQDSPNRPLVWVCK